MNFDRGHRIFQPSLKPDRNEWIPNLLTIVLVSAAILEGLFVIVRWLGGEKFFDPTIYVNVTLLSTQLILLLALKRGYVRGTVLILVLSTWTGMTYLAWLGDGVWDIAVIVYIPIILIAALFVEWRFSLVVSLLSIFAIWGMAIGELRGQIAPVYESPIRTALELSIVFILLIIVVYLMDSLVGTSFLALKESEQKYRNFIEDSAEGVLFLAFDHPISIRLPPEEQVVLMYKYGYIAECNNSFARAYGYDAGTDVVGRRLEQNEEDSQFAEDFNRHAMLSLVKEGYRSENRKIIQRTRMGETVHLLSNTVGILKGEFLTGLWSTQLDLTPLKKAEDALRRSESRTQALLDAIPDMIFEIKRDGTILRFVPSTTNRPLLPPEEFIGKTIAQVIPSVAEQTAFAIDRVLTSGLLSAFEYELPVEGEIHTYEARITPAGPDLVLAMVRDVTLRRWAETERESLIDELESKNAELERFTYTVSHDLKSPLITIRGFLGFIREDIERGNRQRLDADIQRIIDATNKMQTLLNDLLELSRIGRLTNQPEIIKMNQFVDEVLEFLHGRLHSANVVTRVEEYLPDVYGDRQRLFEVFQNLIDNAAKFMGSQPNPTIEIGVNGQVDGKPVFLVRDNGMGIEDIYKENIFGLFNKLDSQTEGTGIGLTLVKRIIEFHGGRIWVESEAGKGSTFLFTLPPGKNPEN